MTIATKKHKKKFVKKLNKISFHFHKILILNNHFELSCEHHLVYYFLIKLLSSSFTTYVCSFSTSLWLHIQTGKPLTPTQEAQLHTNDNGTQINKCLKEWRKNNLQKFLKVIKPEALSAMRTYIWILFK